MVAVVFVVLGIVFMLESLSYFNGLRPEFKFTVECDKN
jgi:hypothetical protein